VRILITNDDGINAPALKELAKWAKKHGEVTVVAPKIEQSGKSHGIEIIKAMEIQPVDLVEGVEAYSVDSTPADCVRYGIIGLKRDYDLVISGINRGFNLGKDIVYSGTVGAVYESAGLGFKSVALSTAPHSLDLAIQQLDNVFDFFGNFEHLFCSPAKKVFIFSVKSNIMNINCCSEGKFWKILLRCRFQEKCCYFVVCLHCLGLYFFMERFLCLLSQYILKTIQNL
jgi:5'/3'-nucleotidase SurE